MSDIQWREVSIGGWYDAYDNGGTVRKTLKNQGADVVYEVAVEKIKLPTKAGAIVAKPGEGYYGYVLGADSIWHALTIAGSFYNVPRETVQDQINNNNYRVLFEGYE